MFPHTRADFLFRKARLLPWLRVRLSLHPIPVFATCTTSYRATNSLTCSSSKLIGCVTVGSVICIGPDCRNAIWRYENSIAPAKSSVDHTGDMIPSADRETGATSLCGTRDLCAAFCAAIPPMTSKSCMRSRQRACCAATREPTKPARIDLQIAKLKAR